MMSDAVDPEQLTRVIGLFYDAVLDPDLWPSALEQSCGFVGGATAHIFWQDVFNENATVIQSWGEDPDFRKLYFETYLPLNPFFPAIAFIEIGVVIGGDDLVSRAEFLDTRFYKEWARPQGFVDVIGFNLERYATSASAFAIWRHEEHGLADAGARRRTALLVPHVRRAVAVGREIDRHRAKSETLERVLGGVAAGVFMVDARGRLCLVNDAGRDLLDRRDVLVERDGALVCVDKSADRILRDALAVVATSRDLSVGRQPVSIALTAGDGPRWLAHVLPLASGARLAMGLDYSAVAALFVRKAELEVTSALETMAKIYRLTPSEIRVLQAALVESGVGDIAEALGIAVGTVKTHLASLFSKTGTRRRADLVKAVAAHGSPLV